MTVETAVFTCSICGEPSKDICVFCTKDACANHRCERCRRCSDCCECEVPLSAVAEQAAEEVQASAEAVPVPSDNGQQTAAIDVTEAVAETATPNPEAAESPEPPAPPEEPAQ